MQKTGALIETVVRTGIRSNGQFFRVCALPGAPAVDRGFVAVVVGKKQHRFATTRNRIRRRSLAAARECLAKKLNGYAVVLIPSPQTQKAPYKTLCDEISAHVIRIKNYHSTHRRIPAHNIP